ncbi:ABC transporter permease [Naumannella halotolerans]|uniref:NitT/TauT family transport system permease protein n=1 Tax=Naumannella halotolerans TaxID=993414 RepID=A0A4R7IWS4_9ACTN|nr:ABC transporter permease subunit [Naumannella halotolerans]TDT29054.1 NitT/TauT family transport system permease protein [Naumannella halotolerans]
MASIAEAPATRVIAPVALGVIALGLWQALAGSGVVDDYLLPSPGAIAGEFVAFAPELFAAAKVTGWNALVGLVGGTVIGVVLALAASMAKPIDAMAAPVVAALAVVPIVALAPVLNTMFGADAETGRQMIAGLAAFTPVFVNTLRGLRQTRPVHRELLRAYAASTWQTLRVLTLPAAVPFIFTGVRIASSLAVISALVAEYFGGPRGGIGSFITTASASSQYARAWAYVAVAILLGLVFFLVTAAMERWATARGGRPSASSH